MLSFGKPSHNVSWGGRVLVLNRETLNNILADIGSLKFNVSHPSQAEYLPADTTRGINRVICSSLKTIFALNTPFHCCWYKCAVFSCSAPFRVPRSLLQSLYPLFLTLLSSSYGCGSLTLKSGLFWASPTLWEGLQGKTTQAWCAGI